MSGVNLTTVKELLGHKTLTMTLRYSHPAPGHKVKAVELFDSEVDESELYKNYTISNESDEASSCRFLQKMVEDKGVEPSTS